MRCSTALIALAMSTVLALAAAGCKGKPSVAKKAPKSVGDIKRPAPQPVAKPGLFSQDVFRQAMKMPATRHPNFQKFATELPKVAAACKKSKKYVSSFTWCAEWKAMAKEIRKIHKAINKRRPETVQAALAVALAAVSKLQDKDLFVRYAGLAVLDITFYDFSYKKLRSPRRMLARAVATAVKNGTDYNERKQAVRLLGCDGGLSHFNGDVYDGKVLAWAAHKDKSEWVRQAALGNLASCIDRLKGRCPVTPSQLKTWIETEKNKTARESIANLAGKLKMADEVFAWCSPIVLAGQMHWGCEKAFKAILDKGNFPRFLALGEKFRDSDKSKTRNNFRMVYFVQLLWWGMKSKNFPREKVVAFQRSVLAQKATATTRAKSIAKNIVDGFVKHATTEDEIGMARKLLRKYGRKIRRLVRRDKNRKSLIKLFKDADKKLKEKAESAE